jgi:cell division septum initiation protein DivIVA
MTQYDWQREVLLLVDAVEEKVEALIEKNRALREELDELKTRHEDALRQLGQELRP